MAYDMRLMAAATGFLVAALFSAMGGPSLSSVVFSPESRLTDLFGRDCEVDASARPASAREEQVKRCPGLGGARVVVTADADQVALGYEWSGRERADEVLRNWSLGPKLEWRGIRTSRGFEPYATLVRASFNGGAGPSDDRPVLAVMRVRRGEACVIGFVDVAGNADPEALARRLADARARTFACGRDQPLVEGAVTARTSALLGGS